METVLEQALFASASIGIDELPRANLDPERTLQAVPNFEETANALSGRARFERAHGGRRIASNTRAQRKQS
jgi:hypothetical protein